jgi:hypothetical protein
MYVLPGCLCAALSGCGLHTPDIAEVWEGPEATKQLEFEIRRKIYCELKEAVQAAKEWEVMNVDKATGKTLSKNSLLPDNWVAEFTAQLQVDESTAVNPGVALNTPIHSAVTNFKGEYLPPNASTLATLTYPFLTTPQTYSLGLGGTLSSTATRIDRINGYWNVSYLNKKAQPGGTCYPGTPDPYVAQGEPPTAPSLFSIEGELGLKNWLRQSLENETFLPSNKVESAEDPVLKGTNGASKNFKSSSTGSSGKSGGSDSGGSKDPDQLQIELKFVIITSGNVTPTWKLVRVSANTANTPLFSSGRTRTHDLLITVGPGKNTVLNQSAQIGQSVAAGLKSTGQ